jgi:hypothetical protein
VSGFGATLFSDLERIGRIRPNLPTIAVNMAAGYVKAAHLFSCHWEAEKLGSWARQQRDRFGDGFLVHAPGKPEFLQHNVRNYKYVDHWWDGVISRGSSGWSAARLALAMGFDEVVLAGVPMDHGRYANGGQAILFQSPRTNSVSVFRKAIALDTPTRSKTYSLSGWTADVLGLPPFIREAEHAGKRVQTG